VIEVVAVAGVVLVQDGGRPGRMHEGVPPGGPLVPELLARANAAVSNRPGEAGLEIFGSVTLAARRGLELAADDGVSRRLATGDTWRLACGRSRVRYAAVRGAIAVPEVLGGRGTLLVAGLGGHEGRVLRAGDLLPVGDVTEHRAAAIPIPSADESIQIVPGPDGKRFGAAALDVLLGSEYRVSARSDRVGLRLVGPALDRADGDDGLSAPMVRGAIQVPSCGEPIVLGPDHPTMGGYPVIATVVTSSIGALMLRAPGSVVRFARVAFTPFVTKARGGGI
jgi:biotin-dependent carboxylase-like uncharacterized protein